MPDQSIPPRPDIEEASSRLEEGLKSCRAVVKDYRTLLTGDQDSPAAEQPEDSDKES